MSVYPSDPWSELTPAGGDSINAGDNKIRQAKTQIREVIDVDHDFPSSGQAADVGQHKRVTLQEQADLGTGATGVTILGGQTIAGKPELVYTNEDDADIQITTGDKIRTLSLKSASASDMTNLLAIIYPVGTIYSNKTVSTNPGTLFGIGTWEAIEGFVVAGYKSGDANFGTAGATVGVASVTLTAAQSGVPAHTHPQNRSAVGGASNGYLSTGAAGSEETYLDTGSNTPANAAEAHSNIQPTLVAYCWVRTA